MAATPPPQLITSLKYIIMVKTKTAESKIKEIVKSDLEARQDTIAANYQRFLDHYKGYDSISSAGILWKILGENNHLAVDTIFDMKQAIVWLLGFLGTPDIAQRFKDYHDGNACSTDRYLIRLINALDWADNPYSRSETALYEMEMGTWPEDYLDSLEKDLEDLKKKA